MSFELGLLPLVILAIFLILLPAVAGRWLYSRRPEWLKRLVWLQLGFTAVFFYTSWRISQNWVVLQQDMLTISAGLYQTHVTGLSDVSTQVQVIKPSELGDYAPQAAINGIRLPNYQVGWFKLSNEKSAFVMLIGEQREVSVVEKNGLVTILGGNINRLSQLASR